MQQIKWMWSHMKGYKGRYICFLIFAMIPQIMMLINPMIIQRIVDDVLYKIPGYGNQTGPLVYKLVMLITLMIGFTIVRTIIWRTMLIQIEACGQRFLYETKNTIFEKMQRLDRNFYKQHQTGDLMTRLTGDIEMGKHGIVHLLRGFLECFVLYMAAVGFMLSKDVILTLSLMVFTPLIFLVTYRFAKTAHSFYAALREKLSELNSNVQENIEGNRVVKAFARENYEKEKFGRKNMEYRNASLDAAFVWLRFYPAIEGFSQALPVVVFLLGGIFLIRERISGGTFLAFNSMCWTLAAPMRTLGILVNDTQRFFTSMDKVIDFYESEPSIQNGKEKKEFCTGRISGKIEFKDVSVKLENNDILDHVSLVIEPGETVALMGPTGSGKTTLVNCISRFVDITEGELLIDDKDVKDYDLNNLRKNIGIANQDVFLFSDTIDRNIAFGNIGLHRPQIERFARNARADFVWGLEDGFSTVIGEQGVGLSGGQRQRLALARALAVSPVILILDDSTSAVDMDTEASIQKNLEELDYTCTKIIIAQRIFSAMGADKILVMDHGKIVECGTHQELLEREGYYYEIYMMQKGGV